MRKSPNQTTEITKDTNLHISDQLPENYFPEVEKAHPGSLASQWIPMDKELWKIEHFESFLEARRTLLAAEANRRMSELLHDDLHWMEGAVKSAITLPKFVPPAELEPEAEEELLDCLNEWVEEIGLPRGVRGLDLSVGTDETQQVVLDLAWPNGLQEELSEPVALLINASREELLHAGQARYRCFTIMEDFKVYVQNEVLATELV